MPTVEARVETDRPSRYLVQLCKHFSNKGRHLGHRPRAHGSGDERAFRDMRAVAAQAQVEWSDTDGQVDLPWGRVTLRAAPGALTLRVEAVGDEDLRRLQDVVAGHVERFGRRDGLQVSWQRPGPTAGSAESVGATEVPGGGAVSHRKQLRVVGLVGVIAVVLAVHLGLAGAVVANWQWTGWAVAGVLMVILVKATVLGRYAIRRARATKNR
ncbi:DUF2218 domain-containing protein [Streptomyces cavernae]|uniref:DUF2218 domain-containing protein n=1 Tax=Streptomyces cavernae TaxID=2259034 RepID=UPI000FEB85E0|nr:DUF2218 domain-containing protein [Streptomyces cavernae]